MLRNKDRDLKKARMLKHKMRENAFKPTKKNIRYKRNINFQVCGTEPLKFCKAIPLTRQNKKLLGNAVINKILPTEARQPGIIPWLSIFRNTKENFLVLKCDLIEHEELLKHDDQGRPYLEQNTNFSK